MLRRLGILEEDLDFFWSELAELETFLTFFLLLLWGSIVNEFLL